MYGIVRLLLAANADPNIRNTRKGHYWRSNDRIHLKDTGLDLAIERSRASRIHRYKNKEDKYIIPLLMPPVTTNYDKKLMIYYKM